MALISLGVQLSKTKFDFRNLNVNIAVNTSLIAVECDNNQDFASQEVMVSIIFSAVTLTSVIYLARILFLVVI